MIEALLAFCFYLVLAAMSLLVFWILQIRYGHVADLDPNDFLVRWFAKKKAATHEAPMVTEMVTGSAGTMVVSPVPLGTVAIAITLGLIATGEKLKQVHWQPENEAQSLFCPNTVVQQL